MAENAAATEAKASRAARRLETRNIFMADLYSKFPLSNQALSACEVDTTTARLSSCSDQLPSEQRIVSSFTVLPASHRAAKKSGKSAARAREIPSSRRLRVAGPGCVSSVSLARTAAEHSITASGANPSPSAILERVSSDETASLRVSSDLRRRWPCAKR